MKHKALLISIIVLSFSLFSYAQDEITMVVSGSGETKDEAVASALRSGIEQSFGSFVSSNTSILNDELVKDEIVSVTSGVVKSYEEVGIEKLASGTFYATLRATFSLNQMTVYAKSKGSSAELSGNVFAMNMKLREMNKRNEVAVLENLLIQVKEMVPYAFERTLKLEELSYVDENNLCLPLQVSLKFSDTGKQMLSLILNTLKNLAISGQEIEEYKQLNVPYFLVRILETPFLKGLVLHKGNSYDDMKKYKEWYGNDINKDWYDGMADPYKFIKLYADHHFFDFLDPSCDDTGWYESSERTGRHPDEGLYSHGFVFRFFLRNAESLDKLSNMTKMLAMESHNFKIISNQNDVLQCFFKEEYYDDYDEYLLAFVNSLNSPNGAISLGTELSPQRCVYYDETESCLGEVKVARDGSGGLRSVRNFYLIPGQKKLTPYNEFLLPKIKLTIKSDYISKYSSFNIERIPE